MRQLTIKKCNKLRKLINEFKAFELTGPSSDPDKITAVVYSFKHLLKNILYYKDYIKDDLLRNKMESINVDFDFNDISTTYEINTDMIPIIDDLEDYLDEEEQRIKNNKKESQYYNLSKFERFEVISEIACTLQEQMTTTSINVFLGGYDLNFEKEEVAQSKRVYVENILASAKDDVIIDISKELDITINSIDDVEVEKISTINFNYISEQIKKCKNKLSNNDYEGAITNARSLVESVCYYILEDSGEIVSTSGDLIDIYKKVSKVLKMEPKIYNNDYLKQISSGFFSIINGISSLRNELSDSHGKSKKGYYKPDYRHAMLAVNSSKTISEFLYSSWENRNKIN